MVRVPHLHGIVKKLLPPLLLLLGLATFTTAQIGCIGDDGSGVEWYIIYKLPKITKVVQTQVVDERVDGYHYLYTDNRIISTDKALRLSQHSLEETDIEMDQSAVQHTLKQIYSKTLDIERNQAGLIYVMYNDQFPGQQISTASYGHAKGVTAFGSQTGFWMVHSVPNFPNSLLGGYEWPGNGLNNGQVMLCISLTTSYLQQVSTDMVLRQVYAYETHVEVSVLNDFISQQQNPQEWQEWKASVEAALEEIGNQDTTVSRSKLLTQKYPQGTAAPNWMFINTFNPQENRPKQRVHFVAKTSAYGVNFYSWLAEFYRINRVPNQFDGMRVQTWRSGSGGPLPSYCPDVSYSSVSLVPTFMVQNVQLITAANTLNQPDPQLRNRNGAYTVPFTWSYRKDHSKWGIGIGGHSFPMGIVCIGDVNRVLSQGVRAGGAICIPNQDLYDAFNKLIPNTNFYERCPE